MPISAQMLTSNYRIKAAKRQSTNRPQDVTVPDAKGMNQTDQKQDEQLSAKKHTRVAKKDILTKRMPSKANPRMISGSPTLSWETGVNGNR
ncbi:hypothetical protein ABE057_15295 [Bacillus paralicheniformis]|uniref:hypothetical protein n=1 Tax=Bacillus TaxID=1386 RepID=UPI001FB948B7|nr:hypothetical protein [Bacillus sp. B19-2]MCJ2145715.1 hypothetical protein [Bacillus sp. B19-2]